MNIVKHTTSLILLSLSLVSPHILYAKGEVTQINTHSKTANSLTYSANGDSYTWQGNNLVIDSFDYNGKTYNYDVEADRVMIKRVDNAVITGEKCVLFVQSTSQNPTTIFPEYPRLGNTDNCDMAAVMGGRIINRGALDVFNNGGNGRIYSAKNIERVDFIFSGGIPAPYDSSKLSETGVVATEKSGNNDFLVAAILALDSSGQPSSYSKPVHVYRNGSGSATKYSYGMTNIAYEKVYVNNEASPTQGYPYSEIHEDFSETLGMVFIDLEAFELTAGQIWYGFSYFSPDVGDTSAPNALGQVNWKSGIDPVNYAGFPLDTDHSYERGDADLYGGVGGYFVDNQLSNISGTAFKDDNKNNSQETGEEGVTSVKVTLYKDNNDNGSIQPSDTEYPSINTDSKGQYSFVGVPNGNYIVVIDKNDSDTPVGYLLNQNETKVITINNADSNNNNYPYIVDTITSGNSSTLDITKSVSPTTAVSGSNLIFTITVTNNGDTTATGVKVVDDLSSAVSYISDDSSGSYNQSTGLWTVGTINKNNSKTLNITVRVN